MNMKLSLSTLLIVFIIVFFSILIANLSNLIATHVEYSMSSRDGSSGSTANFHFSKKIISNDPSNLMWFMQISDIHISIFQDPARIEMFQEFCKDAIPAIKPSVVLASGDLTDAKTYDNMGSTQQKKEWEIYQSIISDSHVTNKTVWLDIRGNHDNFNIPDDESSLNYYKQFSIQGVSNPHSYIHIADVNGNRYAFLGVDACLSPGPKRPFNFVGMLTANETNNIKNLLSLAQERGVEYTIVFGHYPTSCILSPIHGELRQLVVTAPGGFVYLCGHFHMLGGLVPRMYTIQKTGFLELELADWKDNRVFRVAAMDHGLFSFVDVKYGDWPIMLVTNPKHALFTVPGREPVRSLIHSTHIRILVFSLSPIEVVQVSVDDGEWWAATRVPGDIPLYVVQWNSFLYKNGIHTLHVRARDTMTRERGISQPFSLDNTRLSFRFWPRVALMSNVSLLFQSLFGLSVCLSVVPLCVFRVLHTLVIKGRRPKPQIRNRMFRRWTRQLWVLASVDRLFYPLILYPIYLSIGPWTIGEIIDGHVGAVFAWGIVVNSAFLPGSFTYAYGFIHICSYQLPLTLILAHNVEKRFQQRDRFRLLRCWEHAPLFIVVTIQCAGAYFFWLAYGTLAFFLGPMRTWSIVVAIVLWYQANTMPKTAFREVNPIWDGNPTDPISAT